MSIDSEKFAREGLCMVDDFVSSTQLEAIHSALPNWRENFAAAKVGRHEVAEDIRRDLTWWLDRESAPPELRDIFAKVEEQKLRLNRSLFLGLKDWEAHLALYAPGGFYKKHLDRHRENSHRRVSVVIYLNGDWQARDGGELVLYDKHDEVVQRVLPHGGRAVFFLSEEFPHEVRPAHRERLSLTGWFLDAPRSL